MTRLGIASLNTLLIAAFPLFSLLYVPAYADDIKDAQELSRQGKHTEALDQLNKFLTTHPKDAQARFQKGVILTELNKSSEAIKVFSDLTQDYPSLPEPYNNLAVLYFSLGQYDKAKNALEAAIRTHPTYATAHENLGDIYAKMATQAYDKALQLDKSNTTAQTKLALVKELFTPGSKGARPASAKADSNKLPFNVAEWNAPKTQTVPIQPPQPVAPAIAPKPAATPLPVANKSVATPTPTAITPAPVKVVTSPPAQMAVEEIKKPEKQSNTSKPSANHPAEVLKTLNAWAKAWSSNNAKAYLAFYAKEFKTPNGEKRADWEQSRKERINKAKSIQVAIVAPEVKFIDATHASIKFKQLYKSDTLQNSTGKSMTLAKSGDKWMILEEKVGR